MFRFFPIFLTGPYGSRIALVLQLRLKQKWFSSLLLCLHSPQILPVPVVQAVSDKGGDLHSEQEVCSILQKERSTITSILMEAV
jgi:hypothetical protein